VSGCAMDGLRSVSPYTRSLSPSSAAGHPRI
jgi:hypothetical protein